MENTLVENINQYQSYIDTLKLKCMDYPAIVSIETYAFCNAACNFCPYPNLERKGDKMSDALIKKLITDLEEIPLTHQYEINLSRVNEPFLDNRIFDIGMMINKRLPNASLVFYSNATPLSHANIQKLSKLENINRLNISLNEYLPEAYEKTMSLPMDKTLEVLKNLHTAFTEGILSFPIVLSRVGDGSVEDLNFGAWVRQNFPAFSVAVSARSDWMGLVEQPLKAIPNIGCSQWYKLHILADGREAFCCIDAEGRWAYGNAQKTSLLEIYNSPARRILRKESPSRRNVENCTRCPLLS